MPDNGSSNINSIDTTVTVTANGIPVVTPTPELDYLLSHQTTSLTSTVIRHTRMAGLLILSFVMFFTLLIKGCSVTNRIDASGDRFEDDMEKVVNKMLDTDEPDNFSASDSARIAIERYLSEKRSVQFRGVLITIGSLGLGFGFAMGFYFTSRMLDPDIAQRPGSHVTTVAAVPIAISIISAILLIFAAIELSESNTNRALDAFNEISPKFGMPEQDAPKGSG